MTLNYVLYRILKPNILYGIITLENAVITGGFYLSMHTLCESLMEMIHIFVLPSLLTKGRNLPFTIFAHWLIHYMHNALVMNDSSDKEHLPNISTLDGTHDLFALAIISILLNVFDERTYLLRLDTLKPDIENLQ